jgi:hypothetical protein
MQNNTHSDSTNYDISEDGIFFKLARRKRFLNNPFKLVVIVLLIVWFPLLLLSLYEGTLYSGVEIPFLNDIAMQIRILVALPLLVLLKNSISNKLTSATKHLCTTLLIQEERQYMMDKVLPTVRKLTNSNLTEIVLLLLVFASTVSMVQGGVYTSLSGENSTWMTSLSKGYLSLSMAGRWSVFVTLPVIQFFIANWIWRYIVWMLFLFRFSKANLNLLPTHADNAGGLGIVMLAQRSFTVVFVAIGFIFSGELISQLILNPESFELIRNEALGFIILSTLILILPSAFFIQKLATVRTQGLVNLGKLSTALSNKFEQEWVNDQPVDKVLEKREIDPSLVIDYNSIYESFHRLNIVPVTTNDLLGIAGFLFVPFVPILFVQFSVTELLQRIAGTLL